MRLRVSEIFGPTIQGEGPAAGRRAMFLRLSGCNLDCSWCDTPYTWDWERFDREVEVEVLRSHTHAIEQLDGLNQGRADLVVITGGEPMVQESALAAVCDDLKGCGYEIHVETNGTRFPTSHDLIELVDLWVVSPKLPSSGVDPERAISEAALLRFIGHTPSVLKFVIGSVEDLAAASALIEQLRVEDPARVYLQPEGTTAAAIDAGIRWIHETLIDLGAPPFRISPRLHVSAWGDERKR